MACNDNINPCSGCLDCVEITPCDDINYTNYTDTGCTETYPLRCVIYTGSDLSCISVHTNDNLETVLSSINDKLCTTDIPIHITNTDNTLNITQSGYQNHTNVINTKLSTTSGNAIIKNSDGLYAPIETLLTANDSSSIDFTVSGTHNHTLTAAVKISQADGNIISILSDGLFAGFSNNGIIKVVDGVVEFINGSSSNFIKADGTLDSNVYLTAETDTLNSVVTRGSTTSLSITTGGFIKSGGTSAQFLKADGSVDSNNYVISGTIVNTITGTANQVIVSSSTGSVVLSLPQSISTTSNVTFGNILANQFAKIGGSSSQFLKADGSVDSNTYLTSQTSITVNSTDAITLTATGSNNHTLSANVNISSTANNAIVVNSDGLYVPSSTSYTLPIASGSVLGGIKVGSNLTINGSGVLTTASNVAVSASNGLGISAGNISLGGSLTNDTTIVANGHTLSFSSTSSALNANNIPFASTTTSTMTGTETNQYQTSAYAGAILFNLSSPFTPFVGSKHAVYSGTLYKAGVGGYNGIMSTYYSTTELQGSGSVSTIVQYRAYAPQLSYSQTYSGTITNAVGLYIDDLSTDAAIASHITNKFGIYQEGVGDINRFYGTIESTSGSITTISDLRSKENIVEFTKGLNEIEQINTHRFNYIFNTNKTVTGVIAQELENLIPEAVTKSIFTMPDGTVYEDFRQVDSNTLIYTLINAVKELSKKIKVLEAK